MHTYSSFTTELDFFSFFFNSTCARPHSSYAKTSPKLCNKYRIYVTNLQQLSVLSSNVMTVFPQHTNIPHVEAQIVF